MDKPITENMPQTDGPQTDGPQSEGGPKLRDTERKFLLDPYLDWAEGEGVPIHADFAINMLTAETAPWDRFGIDGAICHLKGRDDFLTAFVYELPPGGASSQISHIYE